MDNAALLDDILSSNGFVMYDRKTSEYFDDYYVSFTNGEIAIRISRSKSFEMVDICNTSQNSRWIDVALMKVLILKEQDPVSTATIGELLEFIHHDIRELCALLSNSRYLSTIPLVEELERRRVQQMFPNWKWTGN